MAVLHRFAGTLVILGLLWTAACAAPATPTPTTAPAKPTATTAPAAKPTATAEARPAATPAAKPTEAAAAKPAAASAAKPATSAGWENTLAAAKKEGKVTVSGGPGDAYRKAVMGFQQRYPEIQLEFSGSASSDFMPKILNERAGGQYLWDVVMGGGTSLNSQLKMKGALAPLKPALLLPEVLDDSKWLGGLASSWADKEKQYVFQLGGYVTQLFRINRDVVPESELNKLDQILEPKWKGKIVTLDPRTPGPSGTSIGWILLVNGEQWLRKFLAQDLVIVKDARTQMEWLVRGRYPVIYGGTQRDLAEFQRQGLGKNVHPLDPASEGAARLTGGTGFIVLVDKAPHPNAAKVFINWMLSREGAKSYTDATTDNTRRLDVPGNPETAPKPGVKYRSLENEELYPNVVRANGIAKEMIK